MYECRYGVSDKVRLTAYPLMKHRTPCTACMEMFSGAVVELWSSTVCVREGLRWERDINHNMWQRAASRKLPHSELIPANGGTYVSQREPTSNDIDRGKKTTVKKLRIIELQRPHMPPLTRYTLPIARSGKHWGYHQALMQGSRCNDSHHSSCNL